MTGWRIERAAGLVGDGTFRLACGDWVADADITRLLEYHRPHGRAPRSQPSALWAGTGPFGSTTICDVCAFEEKPKVDPAWVNGGFFVLSPRVRDRIEGEDAECEREPLEPLASEEYCFRHERPGRSGADTGSR